MYQRRSPNWTESSLASNSPDSEAESFLSEFNGAWRVDGRKVPTGSVHIGSRRFQNLLFTKLYFESISSARDHTSQTCADTDFFSLTFSPSNAFHLTCNNKRLHLAPNQMLLWSSRDELSFDVNQNCYFANLLFPRQILADQLPSFDSSFHLFDENCPASNLAEAYFASLAKNASLLVNIDDSYIEATATSMLLNLLHTIGRLNYSKQQHLSTFNDALRVIDRNLKHAELTPNFVADELGISVRKLHYLFRSTDHSVMATIRKKRLKKAREDLANPAMIDQLSITHIAYRWAFSDPAYFCNAFKSEFGENPRKFRKRLVS